MMSRRDNTGTRILMAALAAAIFLILYSFPSMASSTGTTVHYIIETTQYGADISTTPDQTVSEDNNATYIVTISNNGTLTDSYVITLANLDNASTAQLNQTAITNLSPGQSFNITLTLGDTDPGNYTATVTATSQGDSAVSDSLNITTEVIPGLSIIDTQISPYGAINGSNVTLYIDAENHQAVWAQITRPDNSTVNITLTDGANTIYTGTNLLGRYDVVFYANNSIGEVRSVSDYFEAFTGSIIDLEVIDSNVTGVNSTFISYYRNGSVAINSSSTGNFTLELANTTLDFEFYAYDSRLKVRTNNINISTLINRTIGIDRHFKTAGYMVTYGIEPEWPVTDANVRIIYDDLNYSVEDNLRLYKCDNYNFTAQTCLGTWTDVTASASQNQTADHFQITVTSFSGFSVKEYFAPTTTPGGGGGGGGGEDILPECYEDWVCGLWNQCFNGQQTRECVDRNDCGTDQYRPVMRVACFIPCDTDWECEPWGECSEDEVQTRQCTDNAQCGTRRGMPDTSQHCAYDSCSDGRQNLDEEGVDCGGSCPACAVVEQPRIVERAESNILCILIPFLAVILLVLLIMGRASRMPPKQTRFFAVLNFTLMILALLTLLPTIRCPAGICMAVADTMPIIDEIFLFLITAFVIALSEGLLYVWFERKEKGLAEKRKKHGWLLMLMLLGTAGVMLTALSTILSMDEYHILAYLSPVLISALILAFVVLTRKDEEPPRPGMRETHVLESIRVTERTKEAVEELVDVSGKIEKKIEKRSITLIRKAKRKIVDAFRAARQAWRKKKEKVHRIALAEKRKQREEEKRKAEDKKHELAEEKRQHELSRRLDREKKLETAPSLHYKNPTFSVVIDEEEERLRKQREKERERQLKEKERQLKLEKKRRQGPWTKRVMRSLFPPEKKKAEKKEKKAVKVKVPKPKKEKPSKPKQARVFDNEINQTRQNIDWLQKEKRRLRKKGPESREAERKRSLAEIEVYLEVMQKKLSRLERIRRRMI